MNLEPEYGCAKGKGSSTETAYSVEARYSGYDSVKIGNQIFDGKWREVKFADGMGVPRCSPLHVNTLAHRMLDYPAAQALRWWFICVAEAEEMKGAFCLETRLIKHEIKSSYEITAVSTKDFVTGRTLYES